MTHQCKNTHCQFSLSIDFEAFLVHVQIKDGNGNTFAFNQKLESLHKVTFSQPEIQLQIDNPCYTILMLCVAH